MTARLAGADRATMSMLTYNFGRTTGYTCHLEEAEKYLLEALELEKGVTGPESSISAMRIFELARFYFDRGDYEKSINFYSRGLPVVEKLGVSQSDPVSLANAYEEYSVALTRLGRAADASIPAQRAAELRISNLGRNAGFTPTRYKCPK